MMSTFDVIAFDADDTLWHSESLLLELGGHAAYVPSNITWDHEIAELPPADQPRFFQLENIGQLPALLNSNE